MSDVDRPSPAAAPAQPEPTFRNSIERTEYQDRREILQANIGLADWNDVDGTNGASEFHANTQAINQYLDGLPDSEYAKYANGKSASGAKLLNDPATLRQLAAEARQSTPELVELAKKHGGDELAAINEMRSTDRKGFASNERVRARERDLIDEAEQVKSELASQYPKDVLAQHLAYAREHMNDKGFAEKRAAELIAAGMSPTKAHAVIAFFRDKLKEAR